MKNHILFDFICMKFLHYTNLYRNRKQTVKQKLKRGGGNKEGLPTRTGSLFQGGKVLKLIVVKIAQLNIKTHVTAHFTWLNSVVCKLHLIKLLRRGEKKTCETR